MKRGKYLVACFGLLLAACGTNEQPKPPDTPTPPPVQAVEGKALFEKNCVACHGSKGWGDGPAAAALPNKPANLTSDKVQKKSDAELAKVIREGTDKGMPPWKSVLRDGEVNELVKYLRGLAKK